MDDELIFDVDIYSDVDDVEIDFVENEESEIYDEDGEPVEFYYYDDEE